MTAIFFFLFRVFIAAVPATIIVICKYRICFCGHVKHDTYLRGIFYEAVGKCIKFTIPCLLPLNQSSTVGKKKLN